MPFFTALLAGGFTGLLLGALIGLSASSVVGSVVGGLIALLAAILGLKGDSPKAGAHVAADRTAADVKRIGIAAFGCACIIGVLGGLIVRTRDALALTPAQQVKTWTDAGFSDSAARNIVALKAVGIVPNGATVRERSRVDESQSGVLFAGDARVCDQLNPRDYSDAANLGRAFTSAGGAWKSYATAVTESHDEQARLSLLVAAWHLVCR